MGQWSLRRSTDIDYATHTSCAHASRAVRVWDGQARLLQVEASIKMGQSQQQAISAAMSSALFGASTFNGASGVVLPSKRRRRSNGESMMATSPNSQRPAPPDPNAPFLVLRVRRAHIVEDSLDALAQQTTTSLLKPHAIPRAQTRRTGCGPFF